MAVETGVLPARYASPEWIGSGGMGDIFLATDEVLGRHVVLKLLSERYARDLVTGSDGHALNDQGYRLIQQGDFAGAVPLLQQAVRKLAGTGPADLYEGYANYNLGYALYRSGRCSEAIPYLQRAQQLEPDRSEPGNVLRRARRC